MPGPLPQQTSQLILESLALGFHVAVDLWRPPDVGSDDAMAELVRCLVRNQSWGCPSQLWRNAAVSSMMGHPCRSLERLMHCGPRQAILPCGEWPCNVF